MPRLDRCAFQKRAEQSDTTTDRLRRAAMYVIYRRRRFRILQAGIIHPDFQALHAGTNEEVFWEHFGMMDDHDYAENAVRRIELYEKNGYFPGKQLILTFETGSRPLNVKMIEMIIEQYLE